MEIVFGILLGLAILVYSAILHEIAHGYVADRFGDPTARLSGRLTLNPIKHIDPYMSVLLPLMLIISGSPVIFGGAKPVPVDPFNLKEGRKDIALVSLAGPMTNVLIAIVASLLLRVLLLFSHTNTIVVFLYFFFDKVIQYNLLLAIFNLIPIPPLDGSKIFALILPEKEAHAYLSIGQMGTLILLFLLFFPIGGFSLQHFIFVLYTFARNLLGI